MLSIGKGKILLIYRTFYLDVMIYIGLPLVILGSSNW